MIRVVVRCHCGTGARREERARLFPSPPSQHVTKAVRAFTLVELLVVVSIVALLIAILLPALRRARDGAKRIVCMANLHVFGVGVQTYASEFHGVLPWEGYAEGDRPERHLGEWEDESQWFNAAPQYAGYPTYVEMQKQNDIGRKRLPKEGDRSHFVCPKSVAVAAGREDDLVEDGYFLLWGLNNERRLSRRKTFWSYAYNTELDAGLEDRHVRERVYLNVVGRPAETAVMVERIMRPDECSPPFLTSVGQAAVHWKYFTTRHDDGGFILFLDNHEAFFTRKELNDAPNAPLDYNQPGKIIWNPGGTAN
ncbi:MAG: DUF1559 domain-containing protein [Phycisphaerales bacterium]|nr:DUF1559 domain-containing protein [Phycisphaerales bacterium]